MKEAGKFTGKAKKMWYAIPKEQQQSILNNVWCMHCFKMTTIVDFDGRVASGRLLLKGLCLTCGGSVTRVVEEKEAYEILL